MTKRERVARERLEEALVRVENAVGQAQWTNGYRAAGRDTLDTRDRESAWWTRLDAHKAACRRALSALLRVVRQEARRAR